MELIQAITTTQPQATVISWEVVKTIVQVLVIPFCVYLVNELKNTNKRIDDFRQEFGEIKAILIGVGGKNGLRSRIRRIERKLYDESPDDEEDS